MAFIRGPNIVRNGLVLYLDAANRKSYRGTGTSWLDLTPNNFTGTLTNFGAQTIFSNTNGGNIILDGSNDFISTGFTVANLAASSNFTWLMWCYLSATSAGPQALVYFGNYNNYVPNYEWWGSSRNGTTLSVGNYVSATEYSISTTIPGAGWYQVCQLRSGSTHYLYLNGVSKNSGTFVTPNINSSATLRFGSSGNGATNLDNFNGNIASFQLYNRALSDSEILQNFNATKTRFGL